jgi:hypothetical protein
MTMADGTASAQGCVVAASEKPILTRVRVHLIPAEKDAAEDVLRYHEVPTKADGVFTFHHLALGNYWLLARAMPDDESDEKPVPPVAWEASERAKLRQAAEAANQTLELIACQRAQNFVLKFGTTVK